MPLYELNPRSTGLRSAALRWANASLRQRFDKFDMADEDTLNRILWFAMKGEQPYPAHLAGSHGRGLPQLRLQLDPNAEEEEDDE